MPSTPYIVSGTVTDENDAVVDAVIVTCNNTTNDTYLSATTDSNGNYVMDLANAGYTVGDTLIVSVSTGVYFGETTSTITGVALTVDISVNSITGNTIRDKSWIAVYNHLQSGTYAISTDEIHGAMSDDLVKTSGYPIVIIEPAKTSNKKLMINRDSIKEREISINIMVYHNTTIAVEKLADEVEASLDNGWRNLAGSGLKNLNFLEGDYDWYTDAGKKVHVRSVPITFRYIKT